MPTVTVVELLERLTGEPVPFPERIGQVSENIQRDGISIGYSQFNELLLLAGLDRVTHDFFAYLQSGSAAYRLGSAFASLEELRAGVDRFRKAALLLYGNVKFAFKSVSRDEGLLLNDLDALREIDPSTFEQRHDPLLPVTDIAPEDAYLTGYMVENELTDRLAANPHDEAAVALQQRRADVINKSVANQAAYLASDHLDVYVATSMRARHEFISVRRIIQQIFDDPAVKPLKLRWFDPTQAYCKNRIDKGLAEALMLRRARCTIYLAQESDTLGKDSELASTLAQGKPVIAFVPQVDEQFLRDHFAALERAEPEKTKLHHLMDQLRVFDPGAAWLDPAVRAWCENPESFPMEEIQNRVNAKIKAHYDSRARTLRDIHPLGIQVNLGTGVANGVLVVRTASECANVVRGIMTSTLEFRLEESDESTCLKECVSNSIFRVMTSDAMLTNTFWNFYLDPAE